MNKFLHLIPLAIGLIVVTGCDESIEGEETAVPEASGKADFFGPSDTPDNDHHCKGSFSDCSRSVAFTTTQWGSIGKAINQSANRDEILARAYIEPDKRSGISVQLFYSPEPVSSMSEAEQVPVTDIETITTKFDTGLEVRVTTDVRDFMIEQGRVDGVFYLAFRGTNGTIRAVDVDVD